MKLSKNRFKKKERKNEWIMVKNYRNVIYAKILKCSFVLKYVNSNTV